MSASQKKIQAADSPGGEEWRKDFPLFRERALVFLDSAASTQKPRAVLDAMEDLYTKHYANVHRGVYSLSEEATARYEESRAKVHRFLNSRSEREIVFTKGTTEGINLVAHSWGRTFLKEGDEIVTTILEHHSNFVPWQLLAAERGVRIHYVGLDESGFLSRAEFSAKLSEKTKLVTFPAVANAYGIRLPVEELIAEAHAVGARVLVDAAQWAAHSPIDVQALDVDFLSFSGHKMYGPTGIGILYAKESLLEQMPPFLSGGDMIRSVSIERTTFNELPFKFEAGTPAIAEAVGLGAAVDYLSKCSFSRISAHEDFLVCEIENTLLALPGINLIGPVRGHTGLVTFTAPEIHPHDLAQFLDQEGVCVRAGHHCAQPLMTYLGTTATTRASVGVYNTSEDVRRLGVVVEKAVKFFTKK